jgi:two-component system chemotaxis sensor kinase CheA
MADSALPPELTAMFREELRESVQLISKALGEVENGAEPDRAASLSNVIKRRFHNIKGAANSLSIGDVAKVAHAAETFLARGIMEEGSFPDATVSGLVMAVSWLQDAADSNAADPGEVLARLGASQPPPPPPQPVEPTVAASSSRTQLETPARKSWAANEEVVRVSGGLLEKVLSPLTMLVVARTEGRFRTDRLQQLGELASELSQRASSGQLDVDDVARLRSLATDLDGETALLRRDARRTGQALATLEDHIHSMRLVSLSSLESSLLLAVRDAAVRTNKEAGLSLAAAGIQVDRRVLQTLRAPLIHLVRNAVDHGIEPSAVRAAAGKPAYGTIRIAVRSRGELIDIVLEDDGGGVDVEQVKRQAVSRGLVDPDNVESLGLDEILGLLAHPGFSTRESVSELSGRGIGLDVVHRAVRELGGAVKLESVPGRYTRFTLTVPVSMVTTRVLFVHAGGHGFALPLSGVLSTARVDAQDLFTLDNKLYVNVAGKPAIVHRLASTSAGVAALEGKSCIVIVATPNGRVAVLVDEILGEEEIVVRPLGPPVRHVPGVVGTTLAESGAVVLVLACAEVLQLGVVTAPVERSKRRSQRTILVVDDSITTRTLERHILERAGYGVRLANDGQEALGMMRANRFDLVVADVDMPRLDGISMVRAMRNESGLESLPVILVTSRDEGSDRQRGLAAGAQAYIVKGRFDQDELLDTIARLLAEQP